MDRKLNGSLPRTDNKQSQSPGFGAKLKSLLAWSKARDPIAPQAAHALTAADLRADRAYQLVGQLLGENEIEDGHSQVVRLVIAKARRGTLPPYRNENFLDDIELGVQGRRPVVGLRGSAASKPLIEELNQLLADLGVFPRQAGEAEQEPIAVSVAAASRRVPGGPDH